MHYSLRGSHFWLIAGRSLLAIAALLALPKEGSVGWDTRAVNGQEGRVHSADGRAGDVGDEVTCHGRPQGHGRNRASARRHELGNRATSEDEEAEATARR